MIIGGCDNAVPPQSAYQLFPEKNQFLREETHSAWVRSKVKAGIWFNR